MRIVFLGSELNVMSIAVLDALSSLPGLELTVVHSRPPGPGLVEAAARTLAKDGARAVLRGGMRVALGVLRLARARVHGLARRAGLPLRGFTSLAELARARGLARLELPPLRSPAAVASIDARNPDLILVAAFGQILKPRLLEIPRLGCVNLHPSLLPAYRGPNPFYWVLRQGERTTGVTFHRIDAGIDTGPILVQRELEILPGERERSLERRATELAVALLPELIAGLRAGTLEARPQPADGASYFASPPDGASEL